MRSVPFRVVALLGMDDDAGFPRARAPVGFDLLARKPRIGDRDPRDEDRHLLLEAILSARSHLLVFYSGRDEQTGQARPPAVPIAELLEAIDATAPGARALVLRRQPLQPFAPEAFGERTRTFDQQMHRAARQLQMPRDAARAAPFVEPLPGTFVDALDLESLIDGLVDPARVLLRGQLGLALSSRDDTLDDHMPVLLDGLGAFDLGERILGLHDRGLTTAELLADVRARGLVPPGGLGEEALAGTMARVSAMAAQVVPRARRTSRDIDLDLDLVRVSGRVDDVADDVLWDVRFSSVDRPKRLLRAWIRLLAVAACHGVERAEIVGKPGTDGRVPRATLTAPRDASEHLRGLIALYREGLASPLVSFPDVGMAFARHAARPVKAMGAALDQWSGSDFQGRAVSQDPWVQMLYPDGPPFVDPEGRPTPRFLEVTETLYKPLLAALTRTTRTSAPPTSRGRS